MSQDTIVQHGFTLPNGESFAAHWQQGRLIRLVWGFSPAGGGEKSSAMELLEEELTRYYAGELREFTTPVTLIGTPFQRRVWETLRGIPYGVTTSYSQLGAAAGVRGDRAVGSAVGRNPIPILVPCHRVLPKSGGLGNFSGGSGPVTKLALLTLEGVAGMGDRRWK